MPSDFQKNDTEEKNLEHIREILFSLERSELERLKSIIDKPERFSEEISKVLPDAINRLKQKDSKSLSKALAPVIEKSIEDSVLNNPRPLADALFPIMGPAIRKSISETFRRMIQNLNQTLENSLSFKAIKWRIQASVTGRPFAEVVLLNSVIYEVQQLFLIHTESSLLLKHIGVNKHHSGREDMVSSMLRAIQDFVHDSFKVENDEQLETIQLGELNLIIEQGPKAIMAAVVYGEPPAALREVMTEKLERIHLRHANNLADFEGDISIFDDTEEELRECLLKKEKKKRKGFPFLSLGISLIILLGIAFLVFRSQEKKGRWDSYIKHIQKEENIIISGQGRQNGKYFVTGLKDVNAPNPEGQLQEFGFLKSDINSKWKNYQAFDSLSLIRKAAKTLEPGRHIRLSVSNDTLFISGKTSTEWLELFNERKRLLEPFLTIDSHKLLNTDIKKLNSLKSKIENAVFFYELGKTKIEGQYYDSLINIAEYLKEFFILAEHLEQNYVCELSGTTDSIGSYQLNKWLSKRRSENLINKLESHGLQKSNFTIRVLDYNDYMESLEAHELTERKLNFYLHLIED